MNNNNELQNQINQIMPQNVVSLQNGATTIAAQDLNQIRKQVLLDTIKNSTGEVNASTVLKHMNNIRSDLRINRLAQNVSTMKMLTGFDSITGGRGVAKTMASPAQNNGYFPQNPQFFQMQTPSATPYQQIVRNQQNLIAVAKGYQNQGDVSGMGQVLDQIKRKHQIISEVNRQDHSDSIFTGVPEDAGVNLYRINQKNTRENSIYAFK